MSKKEIERQQILSNTITKWSQYEKDNNNRYHNIRNAIQLLATTSNSLASTDPNRHYISEAELGALNEPVLRDLYLGLLYAELKNKKVDFYLNAQSSKIESWTSLAKIEGTTENALDYLQGVVKSNEQFEKNFANIREKMKKNETVQSEEYTALLQSTQTLLTNLSKTEEIHPDLKLPVEIKKYLDYTNLTLQIAVDLSTENYHATIINLVKLLDAMGESEEMRQFKANVVKYGSFAANVAEAENPEDVKNAIDAIALPAGSFIIKQQTAWNIAINGYIGYSWDYLKPLRGHTLKMHGVYAPVGISFSRGLSNKGKGALTAFASLIDVGGIVSYRLSDSTNQGDIQSGDEASELKQQIRLESIFSPSAHLLISGFKIPIAVGCGWR
ncbi:MAG: hypothetical protein K8F30_14830, partial [Taibaiella sp.]|nr:hypothetical protein [Taibaiella sp.]